MGLGMVATAGAGVIGLSALMNPTSAHADDIGLVIGGSADPIPGPEYVAAADGLYLNNPLTGLYPDLTFYQATAANPFGNGLFTPEGAYPLFGQGVQQLYFNYPLDSSGLAGPSTSVGQGAAILESTILANQAAGNGSTVLGYSQSSTLSGVTMQLLDPTGKPETGPLDPQFLLLADPNNPNGGLFERFNGFETLTGHTTVDQLNLASLGIAFNGATPSDDFLTNVYSLEYDGFTDFPRYPINLLSDLNAFLGIETLHGTYLNGGVDGSGPTAEQIANATLLPGSMASGTADSLTNYYMINETAPLVALLPKQLQELLGPDLTYLINLGYGDGSLGYAVTADSPANVPTPFGLFPDVSGSQVLSTLVSDTQQGFQNLMSGTDPYAAALVPATSSATNFTDFLSALSADAANPAATFTDFVNALSSAASTAYSLLLPTADIFNMLVTSLPAWETSIFTDTLSNGDVLDALGLPVAGTFAIGTLAAGFEISIIQDAAAQIAADFSGLF
ncbi:PE-PPE domain-containing protein [Mycobacterium cookii]|nr:PE-PPE domain-containing protein [Mycobacterium cookii]MCV7330374.1 PE-PPE domain-containing protein [Mycobacterium cookii]